MPNLSAESIAAYSGFLKWGPPGLAGLMLVLAAGALVLSRRRDGLLVVFMVIGALCFLAALVAQAYAPDPDRVRQLLAQNDSLRRAMQQALETTSGLDEALSWQTGFIARACRGANQGQPPQGAGDFYARHAAVTRGLVNARSTLTTALAEPRLQTSGQ